MLNEDIQKQVKSLAKELGFSDCRFASATPAPHKKEYFDWLEAGFHADMQWLAKNPKRRSDPSEVLPNAKSIIVLATNYFQKNTSPAKLGKSGKIARYAWGLDYHDIILKKLKVIDKLLQEHGGRQKPYVDTGPILERDFASQAGIGWNGKSSVQIHRKLGTWFFLSVILTDLKFSKDKKLGDGCGTCRKCIDVCPTGAITAPHVVDSRRCISYLTIENKSAIPEKFRTAIGNRIYGCDDCLEVCPWNRFASETKEIALKARPYIHMSLQDFIKINQDDFRQIFKKSPIKRIKLPAFIRNVCVALGNGGSTSDIPLLKSAIKNHDQLVREHASWAITKIKQRYSKAQNA